MNTTTFSRARRLGIVSLLAAAAFTTAHAQTAKPASGSEAMKQSMMGGMDEMHSMATTGDTDRDFATMMKIHHQGALDMAGVELEQGKSPEMKAMARRIVAAQKKEIAEFDRWLAKKK